MYYGHYIHLYMRMSLKNNLYFNAFNHTVYKINAAGKNHRDNNDQGKHLAKSSAAR